MRLSKSNPGFQFALGEVDLLLASFANMFFVEFVGKDLGFFAAIGTVAGKGLQVFKLLVAGTMLWCGHNNLLFLKFVSDV
jgi:hypothetical protein